MLTVKRIMGSESEFGISRPGHPEANPMRDSARVVDAYAGPLGLRSAQSFWDFDSESPLADSRGFIMNVADAHESQLTHLPSAVPEAQYLANVVLPNGARLYVDHAHPEYSSPEVLTPRDAVLWDRAGDRIAEAAVDALAGGSQPVNLYKNNTDSKGSSYGTHENYILDRAIDFDEVCAGLLPFFATRQILCGAGRVGLGRHGERPGFQISSRADFFEEQIGLETTLRRPIVNTRDEPHAVHDAYRRLHVIIGDATLSQHATWLRMGMTALVLALAEAGTAPRIELEDPVAALQTISRDPSLQAAVPAAVVHDDGTRLSASLTGLDILRAYLEAAEAHCAAHGVDDAATADVLSAWRQDLDDAAADPLSLADRADWAAKLRLLEGMRARAGSDWSDPRLGMLDLQYTDLAPTRSLHRRLATAGHLRVLADEAEVRAAVGNPPATTRAWLRGSLVSRHARQVVGAAWDNVLLRPAEGDRLHRIPMVEPLRGRAADLPGWWGQDGRTPEPAELMRTLTALTGAF